MKKIYDYTTHKSINEIDYFFEGRITIDEISIFSVNENKTLDGIKNFIKSKFKGVIDKIYNWIPKIKKGGVKVAEKCLELIKKLGKYIGKFTSKHQTKITALVLILLVMMVVTVTSTYASTGGDPSDISELANVSLSILEQWGTQLASEKGMSGNEVTIAKSILTEIRDSGVKLDYSFVSEKAQLLVNASMKHADKIKDTDNGMYDTFLELGKNISSRFIYSVNNMGEVSKTIIGNK